MATEETLRETIADLEARLADAEQLVAELREDIDGMYDEEDLTDRIVEAEEAALREGREAVRWVADEAHRILGDLAYRAVTGDTVAVAIENELGPFLKGLLDLPSEF